MTERSKQFAELYSRGMELILAGEDQKGMDLMWQAANIAPEGWLTLANMLIRDKQYALGEERCKEVLKLAKEARLRAAAYNSLGMIYAAIGQVDSASQTFWKSLDEYPTNPDAYSNLGLLAQWKKQFQEALRHTARALRIDPWHEQAQFISAMVKLLDGNYLEGFEEYECRWRSQVNAGFVPTCPHKPQWENCKCERDEKKGGLQKLYCNKPEWDGANGKLVFVYGEQGHGDSILMLRYAREIRKLGLKQAWVCQKSMAPMLKLVPEVDIIVEVGDPLPDFDCHIPSVSLPRIFKTTMETIPPAPYIIPPEDHVDYGPGFHVGICWRGSATQSNDHLRSTNLSQWQPVLDVPGVTFHSLQVENSDEALLYPNIKTYEKPKDWFETVRRVMGLDLVISVDTSIVHLAGALGKRCWCALHDRPYFVYPPKCGDTTPWYASVLLYRAADQMGLSPALQRIASELHCESLYRQAMRPDAPIEIEGYSRLFLLEIVTNLEAREILKNDLCKHSNPPS